MYSLFKAISDTLPKPTDNHNKKEITIDGFFKLAVVTIGDVEELFKSLTTAQQWRDLRTQLLKWVPNQYMSALDELLDICIVNEHFTQSVLIDWVKTQLAKSKISEKDINTVVELAISIYTKADKQAQLICFINPIVNRIKLRQYVIQSDVIKWVNIIQNAPPNDIIGCLQQLTIIKY
jgi:hypothetical protein